MPIYEYRCSACSRVFEALQRVHDEPLDACRHCGEPAERIISSPAIRFVGSGWYVNDYGRGDAAGRQNGSEKEKKARSGEGSRSGAAEKSEFRPGKGSGASPATPGGSSDSRRAGTAS